MGIYLGFDTSNYATSVALYDSVNNTYQMFKRFLPVKKGSIGLRQSDAVFHHTKQLPELLDQITITDNPTAVSVTTRPRNIEGSYMPAFLVGLSAASAVSKFSDIPLYKLSHQQCHILAALYSCGHTELIHQKFLAFHVSGGTTEALLIEPDDNDIIKASIVAKTLDLNAGQAIDRVGNMLGLQFPCGVELEQLANNCTEDISPSVRLYDGNLSLSGIENKAKAMLGTQSPEYIAKYTLLHIASALDKLCNHLSKQYEGLPFVFAGGVMSNRLIRGRLEKNYNSYFASPQFSSDNAFGAAIYGYLKETNNG